jgi:hypothetical protein
VDNDIVVADDATVCRRHAHVRVEGEMARLCSCEPTALIHLAETAVLEVELTEGLVFRIGQVGFECISRQRGAEPDRRPVCPLCQCRAISVEVGRTNCSACGEPILAVRLGPDDPELTLVPADYGEFSATKLVARGGMGMILKGSRINSDEPVAIKLVLPDIQASERAKERFDEELRLMSRVAHANVVRLISHGRRGAFRFLVMEWIDGESLEDVIQQAKRQGTPARYEKAYRWLWQVCEGLAAIHDAGVIHRDIKPSNILIGPDDQARVSDLGIARRGDSWSRAITQAGQVLGTPDYMAPEQRDSPESVDQRADLYAVGVTFYELLTTRRPVGAWRPASALNPSVPPEFDAVLNRILASSPDDRYADARAALAAVPPRAGAGDSTLAVLGGIVLGGVVGLVVGWFFRVDVRVSALIGVAVGAVVGKFSKPSRT